MKLLKHHEGDAEKALAALRKAILSGVTALEAELDAAAVAAAPAAEEGDQNVVEMEQA